MSTTTTAQSTAAAAVDLLGLAAYGELLAFERLAATARLAPDLRRRAVLGELAAASMVTYRRLADGLTALGVEPEPAMHPFVGPLGGYHERIGAKDWLTALTTMCVADPIADDFVREATGLLAEPHGELLAEPHGELLAEPHGELLADLAPGRGRAEFAGTEIREAIAADPAAVDRLSLWARRLAGEALANVVRVAAGRPSLATLLPAEPAQRPSGKPCCGGSRPRTPPGCPPSG